MDYKSRAHRRNIEHIEMQQLETIINNNNKAQNTTRVNGLTNTYGRVKYRLIHNY